MSNSRACHQEFRCQKCEKLLFKGVLVDSEVEVKCKRCSFVNQYQGELSSKYVCLIKECPGRVTVGS